MLFSRLFLKIGQTYQRVNEKEPQVLIFKLQGNKNKKVEKDTSTFFVIEDAQKLLSQGNTYCTNIHLRDLFHMIRIIVHTTEQ